MTEEEARRAPAWLGEHGRREWARIVKKLGDAGVLESVDIVATEAYCRSYETWRRAEEWIDKNGLAAISRNDKGEVKAINAVPHVGISKTAQGQMARFLRECGITTH